MKSDGTIAGSFVAMRARADGEIGWEGREACTEVEVDVRQGAVRFCKLNNVRAYVTLHPAARFVLSDPPNPPTQHLLQHLYTCIYLSICMHSLFFFVFMLLHALVIAFGFMHYQLKDSSVTARATFGITFREYLDNCAF